MKTGIGMIVCLLLASLVPAASALTVDLSSPQAQEEGVTLAPGDTVELNLDITNDSESMVVLRMGVVGKGPIGNLPGISHKPIRILLAPGESVTKTFELVLNEYKGLPAGEYEITLSVFAKGLISKSEWVSDTVNLLMVKEEAEE